MGLNQKDIFYGWKKAAQKVDALSCFVQNDFREILQNADICTKDEIKRSLFEFNEECHKVMDTLTKLKCDTETLLKKYSE